MSWCGLFNLSLFYTPLNLSSFYNYRKLFQFFFKHFFFFIFIFPLFLRILLNTRQSFYLNHRNNLAFSLYFIYFCSFLLPSERFALLFIHLRCSFQLLNFFIPKISYCFVFLFLFIVSLYF